MKSKKLYRIFGKIPYYYGSEKQINEYVHAYSENQAKKLIAIRLKKRHPLLDINLIFCAVQEIKKTSF